MTSKDYVKIASVLRAHKEPAINAAALIIWESLVVSFSEMLGQDNANYQPAKFYSACGYDPHRLDPFTLSHTKG